MTRRRSAGAILTAWPIRFASGRRRCLPLVANIGDSADVQRTVEETLSALGRIDILINNAATARGPDRVPLTELPEQLWRQVLEVKLTGSF